MDSFQTLLTEIKRDCGWEHIPYDKISALAKMCGSVEVDQLICELDALDDADLEDDAGDVADEYWRLRTAYSQALAEVGERALQPLLRVFSSNNQKTREYAARALGLIGNSQAFEPIAALLSNESDDMNKLHFIEALGRLQDERAVEVLCPFLKTPHEQLNRGWLVRMAANALGNLGREEVISSLSEVLTQDPDWFARLGAVEGLCKINHPLALSALRFALEDNDARVRAEASIGLQAVKNAPSD